ncbi:hypothetical protein QBC40DRAFT_351160 [Triangularia verruculosa]|uniref:Uncharacterized protein n=1 Tax=Triangularia verruculosa TaxID=2587418 RepID=A0AAN6XBI6_9PEZI|nr:hypothetical protein QBC40DRAFT_351160 [Triangularia verruculosa]
MQLLAPILLFTAALASATTEQQPFRRQIGSNSTLVTVQVAETGVSNNNIKIAPCLPELPSTDNSITNQVLRAGSPSPTDLGLGSNRFAGNGGGDFFQVSSASSTVAGILGVIGAVVGGAMLL